MIQDLNAPTRLDSPRPSSRRLLFTIVLLPVLLSALPVIAQPVMVGPGASSCTLPPFATTGFWVSSYGSDELLRLDESATLLGTSTAPGLDGPRGITVTPNGQVFVASQLSDEIFVFDALGTFESTFAAAELDGPTGGAIAPNGDYYVCSFGNDSVVRFSLAGSVVDVYESPGLNGPNCIVFRTDGTFLVTGQISNDVHEFAADGTPIGSYIATDSFSVMGAALDANGRLLVAGGASNTISVFDCAGTHLETWNVAGGPQSIALRDDGVVLVTTFFSDEVLWLDSDGTVLDQWTGGDVLRGIEFFPAAGPLPFVRGDANGDSMVDVGDPIGVLGYAFSGGFLWCLDAGDSNDDGAIDIADAVFLLTYLFQAGSAPPPPFPGAGDDPTTDPLGC